MPSAEKQTCNYDTGYSKHHLTQSLKGTGIEMQQDKIVNHIYADSPRSDIFRLPHSRSGDSQDLEKFSASSADKQKRNYDTWCSNCHLVQSP